MQSRGPYGTPTGSASLLVVARGKEGRTGLGREGFQKNNIALISSLSLSLSLSASLPAHPPSSLSLSSCLSPERQPISPGVSHMNLTLSPILSPPTPSLGIRTHHVTGASHGRGNLRSAISESLILARNRPPYASKLTVPAKHRAPSHTRDLRRLVQEAWRGKEGGRGGGRKERKRLLSMPHRASARHDLQIMNKQTNSQSASQPANEPNN